MKLQGYNLKQMTSSAKTSGSTCQAELLKRLILIVKTIPFGSTSLTWREKKGKKKKKSKASLGIYGYKQMINTFRAEIFHCLLKDKQL